MATKTNVEQSDTSVSRCLTEVRNMILNGHLLPGEKVHQAELAERLQVSRIPLREALSTLQSEGILDHKHNTGYRVARFSSDDLVEIYIMRRLLESEILRSIDLSAVDVDALAELNTRLEHIDPASRPDEYQQVNRAFHFELFEYSPLRLVRDEVSRLWYMSSFYRSLYLHEVRTSLCVIADHHRIVEAVRSGDIEKLIEVSDHHRESTEQLVISRLGRSRLRD